jgi:hypothetical protein
MQQSLIPDKKTQLLVGAAPSPHQRRRVEETSFGSAHHRKPGEIDQHDFIMTKRVVQRKKVDRIMFLFMHKPD